MFTFTVCKASDHILSHKALKQPVVEIYAESSTVDWAKKKEKSLDLDIYDAN